MSLKDRIFPAEQVAFARDNALEWLQDNGFGHPRTWAEEDRSALRRPYDMWDDDAPTIAGYEALEREGLAVRGEVTNKNGHERVRFDLVAASTPASREGE